VTTSPDASPPDARAAVWPGCGLSALGRDARGHCVPTPDYWRVWLRRPELALVEESCVAEQALHEALVADPVRSVLPGQIEAVRDPDVRDNIRLFLAFRDAVQRAGTLEAAWCGFFRSGAIQVPPLFLDLLVQAIAGRALDGVDDAWAWRAAELLFRRQRVRVQDGRVLLGDADTLDRLNETGGLGAIGSLLRQAGANVPQAQVRVLEEGSAAAYLASRAIDDHHPFVLDATHEVQQHLSHGLTLTMTRSRSGLKALARVLERWLSHVHGLSGSVTPEARVDDPAWRWHLGLDAESTALLNDLYEGRPVDDARQQRLISLFRLQLAPEAPLRDDLAEGLRGRPIYLGLAMNADGLLKLKPQNLLLNLPIDPDRLVPA
jgi:hypothetical protein